MKESQKQLLQLVGACALAAVVIIMVAGVFFETRQSAEVIKVNAQIDAMEKRCIAEWTDVGNVSHCGHNVKPLGRSSDSLGNAVADVFHCFVDSVRFALPVPRYSYAEQGMTLQLGEDADTN